MINRAVLVGRLTRDPELRTTASGNSVCSFTLAVDRSYKDKQGNRSADFISCVVWRKAAENFANFTNKGSLIGIDGSIQTRSYDDKDGKRVYVTEVLVENFSLLESRKDSQAQSNYKSNNTGQRYQNNAPASNQPSDPFQGNTGDSIDITDDDLPF